MTFLYIKNSKNMLVVSIDRDAVDESKAASRQFGTSVQSTRSQERVEYTPQHIQPDTLRAFAISLMTKTAGNSKEEYDSARIYKADDKVEALKALG